MRAMICAAFSLMFCGGAYADEVPATGVEAGRQLATIFYEAGVGGRPLAAAIAPDLKLVVEVMPGYDTASDATHRKIDEFFAGPFLTIVDGDMRAMTPDAAAGAGTALAARYPAAELQTLAAFFASDDGRTVMLFWRAHAKTDPPPTAAQVATLKAFEARAFARDSGDIIGTVGAAFAEALRAHRPVFQSNLRRGLCAALSAEESVGLGLTC